MTERVRNRTGAPTRWAGPAPDDADPVGGRHVLDQDAGLTPIFTTLRRGAWRRPRPQSGRRALRPVPDPAPYSNDDPWTAPIPVIPALPAAARPHGTGEYGPVGPPVSATESTAWWGLPEVAAPVEHGAYDRGYDVDPYGSGPHGAHEPPSYGQASYGQASYEAARYDSAAYDQAAYDRAAYDSAGYDRAAYEQGAYAGYGYDQVAYEPAPQVPAPHVGGGHDRAPYAAASHEPLPYQPAGYEPVLYGPPHRFPRHDPRPYEYDPLTDTGRHHRLAPAGW